MNAPATDFHSTVGEIASLYDLAESDVLDEVIRAGCRSFWWEGNRYDAEGIRRLVKDWWRWDVTPEFELSLSPAELERLEGQLSAYEEAGQKPLRKFVASQTQLPSLAAGRGKQRTG